MNPAVVWKVTYAIAHPFEEEWDSGTLSIEFAERVSQDAMEWFSGMSVWTWLDNYLERQFPEADSVYAISYTNETQRTKCYRRMV